MKIITPLLLLFLMVSSCSKEEPAIPTPDVVELNIKAYSVDTLEFLHEGRIIATAPANTGFDQLVLMNIKSDDESIALRKKGSTATVGNLQVHTAPFSQVKRIYFDGTTLIDNIDLTPVSDPGNMGLRVLFRTSYPHFSGGLVDIELFEQHWDMQTFEITYHPLNIIIPSIGGSFSGFYELPELVSTPEMLKNYKFKVYRAGTKQSIFTGEADLSFLPDPENNYGSIWFFPGESQLLIIDLNYDGAMVFEDFYVQDISTMFR